MASPGFGVLREPLLSAQSAVDTVSAPINCLGYKEIAIYAKGTGTITGGEVTVETAWFNPSTAEDYAGTWSALTVITASDVSGTKQKHFPITDSAYMWVRTRINDALTGTLPTISTVLVAV